MSNTLIQPYLFFGGRCEEALEFYKDTIGASVEMKIRFNESPEPLPPGMIPEGFEDKIMHACFRVGESTIMASDGCAEGAAFEGFSLSLSVESEAQARRAFDALAKDGEVRMPLDKTFFSPCFGQLSDRFGIGWMVLVDAEPSK